MTDLPPDLPRLGQVAVGARYVGLAVIPRRRRAIERALGRVAELGGEALLITADGSARPRWPGVQHIDLLNDEMHFGPNRLIAVSPKRVAAKLVGQKVSGRSLAWRVWFASRPYKAVRFYELWHVLRRQLDAVEVDRTTHVLLAGVESWPIAWHLAKIKPDLVMTWDVPDEWKRPPELEPLGRHRVAVWGGNPSWHILTQGGDHRADEVFTFAASSWIAQATSGASVEDIMPEGDSFDARVVREDLTSRLLTGIIESSPDVVVLDALGEFSEIAHIGQWCTLSEFTEDLHLNGVLRARADAILSWDDPSRVDLFAEAAPTVARMLLEALPDAMFVLHRVQLPTARGAHGRVPGTDTVADIRAVNAKLDRYHELMIEAFGGRLQVLDLPAELRRPGKPHPRGVVQAGFDGAYYEQALGRLDDVVRERS